MATGIEVEAGVRAEPERRAASLTLPYRVVVRAKLVLLDPQEKPRLSLAA